MKKLLKEQYRKAISVILIVNLFLSSCISFSIITLPESFHADTNASFSEIVNIQKQPTEGDKDNNGADWLRLHEIWDENSFCKLVGGRFDMNIERKVTDYTLLAGYNTRDGRELYPSQQAFCVSPNFESKKVYLVNPDGSQYPAPGYYDAGDNTIEWTELRSFGASFMMGFFGSWWEKPSINTNIKGDLRVPHEPRVDILTNNTDINAYRSPNSTASNGAHITIPTPAPPSGIKQNTDISFSMSVASNNTSKVIDNFNGKEIPINSLGVMLFQVKEGSLPSPSSLTSNHLSSNTFAAFPLDAAGYSDTKSLTSPGNYFIAVPYIKISGKTCTLSPDEIVSITQAGNGVNLKSDSTAGVYQILLDNSFVPNIEQPSGGSAFFLVRATGAISGSSNTQSNTNQRHIEVNTTRFDGKKNFIRQAILDLPVASDAGAEFPYANSKTLKSQLYYNIGNSLNLLTSTFQNSNPQRPILNEKLLPIPSEFIGQIGHHWPFYATDYKAWADKTNRSEYYHPFYSALIVALRNFYAHNFVFGASLEESGSIYKVPRYFSGTGDGAKTPPAQQGKPNQGLSTTQPYASNPDFIAKLNDMAFCGDFRVTAAYSGQERMMPNGKTDQETTDRMELLAEYIDNKMTRVLPASRMSGGDYIDTDNSQERFNSPSTWNTHIKPKYGDPQDVAKMYYLSTDKRLKNVSFHFNRDKVDSNGHSLYGKTLPANYVLVGPFYAHSDYPESRLSLGFSDNIKDSRGSQAELGDEIKLSNPESKGDPSKSQYADYVILTTEEIVDNSGGKDWDLRKTYYDGKNTETYTGPNGEKLKQSFQTVNGNIPLMVIDANPDTTSSSPHEVIQHEPTYWDGTTTKNDIYDATKTSIPYNPKFLINNWGRGEFYVAVREDYSLLFEQEIPDIATGFSTYYGDLTQIGGDPTHMPDKGNQHMLLSNTLAGAVTARTNLGLKLGSIQILKKDETNKAMPNKEFYLYYLVDKNPDLPDTNPNRYEWQLYNDTSGSINPQVSDKDGKVTFGSLIPGWYMLYEKLSGTPKKIDFLQTNIDSQRQGSEIIIEPTVGSTGIDTSLRIRLPAGAALPETPIEQENDNPNRCGDIFYMDNGKFKGLDFATAQLNNTYLYTSVRNNVPTAIKKVKGLNNLVDENLEALLMTEQQYFENIQFVLQAEEDKSCYYVINVDSSGNLDFQNARKVSGTFPSETTFTPETTGEKVKEYWWLYSNKVRFEERINPASKINAAQIQEILKEANKFCRDSETDIPTYSYNFNDANILTKLESNLLNDIKPYYSYIIVRLLKENLDTKLPISDATFSIKSYDNKMYLPVLNPSKNIASVDYNGGYLTDGDGIVEFLITPQTQRNYIGRAWLIEERKEAQGYEPASYRRYITTNTLSNLAEKGISETKEITYNGEIVKAKIYGLRIKNKEISEKGKLTIDKLWFQESGGSQTSITAPTNITINIYRGEKDDRTNLVDTITLTPTKSTVTLEDLAFGDYWIEEITPILDNPKTKISTSYSPSQQVTIKPQSSIDTTPLRLIHIKNVIDDTEKNYRIQLIKKGSYLSSLDGKVTDFANLPKFEGSVQFMIKKEDIGFETIINYPEDADNLGIVTIDLPSAGTYKIIELGFIEGTFPELHLSSTPSNKWHSFNDKLAYEFVVDDKILAPNINLTLQVANNKPVSLRVEKYDGNTNQRLWDSEMTVELYKANPDGSKSNIRIGQPQKLGDDGYFFFNNANGYPLELNQIVWLQEVKVPQNPNPSKPPYAPLSMSIRLTSDIAYNGKTVKMINFPKYLTFKVIKKSNDNQPIMGAVFGVYEDKECINRVTQVSTNSNGEALIENLREKEYWLKEEYVPDNYILDTSPKRIIVENTDEIKVNSITLTNDLKYKLRVFKKDAVSTKPISNVQFSLLDSNKTPYKINGKNVIGVTNTSGYIIWNTTNDINLNLSQEGKYFLREAYNDKGYFKLEDVEININKSSMNLDSDGIYYLECIIKNNPKYATKIIKLDDTLNQEIAPSDYKGISGIKFDIYKKGSPDVQINGPDNNHFVTNSHGIIEINDLEQGDYYAIEVPDSNSEYQNIIDKIPLPIYKVDNTGVLDPTNWGNYVPILNAKKTGSIKLIKTASDTNERLKDITFKLYRYIGVGNPTEFNEEDCELINTQVTNNSGIINFIDLALATYWLVEVNTPSGYKPLNPMKLIVNGNEEQLTIDGIEVGQNLEVRIINDLADLSLSIIKLDASTKKPIKDAVFELSYNGSIVSAVTDINGKALFSNLIRNVKYQLVEKSVPSPYIKDDTPRLIDTNTESILIEKEIENGTKPLEIEVYKYEEGHTDKPIKDVEFQLYANGEAVSPTKFTDNTGHLVWDNLTVGPTYTIKEISTPEGYITDTETEWKVNPLETTDKFYALLEIPNLKEEFYVRLHKIDKETRANLKGAEFHLYKSDKATQILTDVPILTDENGFTQSIKVPEPGTYYFVETKAPDGYILDSRFIEVHTKSTTDKSNIATVTFENAENNYQIKIIKVNEGDNTPLAGAEFTLFNKNLVEIETKIVPDSGELIFDLDTEGEYIVYETKPPKGFKENPTEYKFVVNSEQAIYTKTIFNKQIPYYLTISKIDGDTQNPLTGAVFELYDNDGKYIKTLRVTSENGKTKFEIPCYGTYFLKEITPPQNYTLPDKNIEVIIPQAEHDLVEVNIDLTVPNYMPKYRVGLIKKDRENNNPLLGAKFNLYSNDDVLIKENLETDSDGKIIVEVPTLDTYYFKEIEAPKGYELYPYNITVKASSEPISQLKLINVYNSKKSFSITVFKTNSDKTLFLEGAEFDVYDSEKNKIGSIKTNKSGSATISVPKSGVYYLLETKAPDGFELNTKEIEVSVEDTDNIINNTSITVTNKEEYFIRIIKKDSVTSNTLAGAEFDVYNEDNILVGKINNIGEDGIGQLKVPSLGKYYLVETKAPEGYSILKERIEILSSVNPLLNTISVYNEKSKLIITVVKKDEDDSNKYLIGAEFDVFDEYNKKIAHIVTDENGMASFDVKTTGTYYLLETKAPPNYECRTDRIEITLDNSGEPITNVSITVTNSVSKKYYIRVTKTDIDTKLPLGNAVFEIYKEDKVTKLEKNLITTLPLGSEKIEVPGPGIYYLKEIVSPIGYELFPDLIEVIVEADDTIVTKEIIKDVTVTNKKSNKDNEFWIRLYKVSKNDNIPLSGATFEVYDKDYILLGTMTTVANGTATFKVPNAGAYYIKEIISPEGYIIDSKFEKIVVDDVGSDITIADVTRTNDKCELYIEIFKHDEKTLIGLEGSEFSVFDTDNNLVGTIKTDIHGKGQIKVPKEGTYYLKETKAPTGYELNTTIIPVQVTFSPQKETIIKVDIPNKKSRFYIEILKIDETSRLPIKDVEFNVFDNKSNLIGTIITDTMGKATIEVPAIGTYILKEIKAPAPYKVDPNPIIINVVKSDELVTIIKRTITNIPKDFYIEVLKQDEDTKIPLENAEFEVRDNNNKVIGKLITDKTGIDKIKVPSAGLYHLIETKPPEGYLLNPNPIDIEVVDDGKIITIIKVNIPNKAKKFYIEVFKQDENTHIALEGAEFEVRGNNNYLLGIITTDSNGKAQFEVPSVGLYHLIEIKPPHGYIRNPNPIDVNVVDDDKVITIIKVNVPNTKPKLYIEVLKQDEQTHIPLNGATFELYDKEYNLITTGTTKNEGKLLFEVSNEGIYFLKEVVAPEGYVVNPNLITVHVSNKDETITIIKVNVPNKPIENHYIQVVKQDKETKVLLENAEFEVYNSNLDKIGIMSTGSDGTAKFEVSSTGLYYLKEIKAPIGYSLYSQILTVNVTSSDKDNIAQIIVDNTQKKYIIKVIKRDKDSLILLPNAEFDIFDCNNIKLGSLKTGEDGSGFFKVSSPGIYYLEETKAPDGYILSSKKFEVEVIETDTEESVGEITIENTKETNEKEYFIKVIKKDKNTQLLLPNAEFDIFDFNKNLLGSLKTGEDGSGMFKVVSTGIYYLKETKAPDGYSVSNEVITVQIDEANKPIVIKEITVENTKKEYFLKVIKRDKDTQMFLANAEFDVFDFNFVKLGSFKTDSDGIGIFKVPSTGTYYLKETSAPDNYFVPTDIFSIEIKESNEDENLVFGELTIDNLKKDYYIRVVKKDKDRNIFLPDAEFDVFDAAYNKIGSLKTDETGIGEFKVSSLGVYYLKETKPPTGYNLYSEFIPVEIKDYDGNRIVAEIVVDNLKIPEEKEYYIRLLKRDKETKILLADAEFEVYDSNSNELGILKIGENGIGEFKVSSSGIYFLKEIKAPDGYGIYSEPLTIQVSESNDKISIGEITVENTRKKYYIEVLKQDKETKIPLADAEFDVFDSNFNNLGRLKTDKNGIGKFEVEALGTYYLKEVKAPNGYTLDTNSIKIIIKDTIENVITVSIVVDNIKIPKDKEYQLKIIKKDKNTQALLPNAEFDVFDSDNNKIGSIKTSEDGTSNFKIPLAGTYYLKETKAPNGYMLYTEPIKVIIKDTEEDIVVVEVTVENTKVSKDKEYFIKVVKKDKDTKIPLPNAEFDIFNSDNNKIGSMKTGEDGTGIFKVPLAGTYYLKETKAPDGYILYTELIEVIVKDTEKDLSIVDITIENTKNPKNKEYYIKVIKKDRDTKELLANAEFNVLDSDLNILGNFKTDNDGSGLFKVPSTGIYYLKEIKAPNNYELYTSNIMVKVDDANQNIVVIDVIVENIKKLQKDDYWIKIYKKDAINNAPLGDAAFEVFDANFNSLGTFNTTLPDGFGSFKVDSRGTYYLKEIKAPDGYKIKEGYIAIIVDASTDVVQTTIYNEKIIEKEHWIKVYKKDKVNNAPLGNAIFEVYDSTNAYIGKMITSLPTGGAEFKVSHEGIYYLKEIQAPDGYILKPDLIPVEVNSTANVVEKTIFNEQKEKEQYIIRVYKKDEINNAPIKDAIIGIYDSNKNLLGELKTTIPDGSGYFTVDSEGTYYLKEHQAPKGYILKKGFIKVAVTSNTNIVETSIYNKKISKDNDTIIINKTDENGNKLQGVRIGVFDTKGNQIDAGVTNAKGQIIFDDLEIGNYYIQELNTLSGYIIDSKRYDIKVTNKGDIKEINIINYKEVVSKQNIAKLVIKKYIYGTTTPIAGVEFNIRNNNNFNITRITDSMGCIYLDLPEGTYTIKETKTVDGFLIDNQEKDIILHASNIAQELIFTNKLSNGTFVLTKYDIDNKTKLENADFVLYNADTNLAIRSLTTDNNGTIHISLPYGNYSIKEVEAPSGYILNVQNQQNFSIKEDTPIINLSMTNEKIPIIPSTPQTGRLENKWLISIVLIFSSIISLLLLIYLNHNDFKLIFRGKH